MPGGANKGAVNPVFVNVEALGISSATSNSAAAAAWLKWVSDPKVGIAITTRPGGNWPLLYKSVLDSAEYRKVNQFADLAIEQLQNSSALYWPNGENAVKAAQDLADQVANALAGQADSKAALDIAQESWVANVQPT